MDIRSLLTELVLKLDAEGIGHGEIIYNAVDDPSKVTPRQRGQRVYSSLLDAALFPNGTEHISCKFDKIPGFYVSGTQKACINFGQSDVSMLGRLSHKKESLKHRWWVVGFNCDAVGGLRVDPNYTRRAQDLAFDIYERHTGRPWPRGRRGRA